MQLSNSLAASSDAGNCHDAARTIGNLSNLQSNELAQLLDVHGQTHSAERSEDDSEVDCPYVLPYATNGLCDRATSTI